MPKNCVIIVIPLDITLLYKKNNLNQKLYYIKLRISTVLLRKREKFNKNLCLKYKQTSR